ncbi:protein of unknown function [Candidatus Nitrosotalea okcheonensis]|uniref:Uncharacterized protein n=1 Tax=Candidatus Nitrosotalea okcheonensis TaxID=1903276 RepID=A0A2H1FEB5_9ARCH|nr:protein of unknown function [Candidatus Nitrosotalea okcheonensis]
MVFIICLMLYIHTNYELIMLSRCEIKFGIVCGVKSYSIKNPFTDCHILHVILYTM